MKEDCLFCKLANGVFPTNSVYEDDMFNVIMDISPISKGHCLVLCKEHYDNALVAPEEILSKAFVLAAKIANAVKKTVGCDGINILQNNGVAAEQTVFHLHLHIIPRWDNDGIKLAPEPKTTDVDLAELAKMIGENI